jgi:16S rRNA G527 N7-methylase RsmG
MFDLERLSLRLRPLMPLTALNTCWRFLDKSAQSTLDVGCGKGAPMKFINRAINFYMLGLDIFKPRAHKIPSFLKQILHIIHHRRNIHL